MTPTESLRVAIKTLGCKVNQYEGEQLREALEALGFVVVPFGEPAEAYVINSCTVTATADRDTRRLARQARRRSPGALVAVTGCYAEGDAEELARLGVADLIVGNDGKLGLPRRIAELLYGLASPEEHGCEAQEEARTWGPAVRGLGDHTRAFVKVQEGCDAHCAYCIVPQVRGPGRSMPKGLVMEQVRQLIAGGCPELVLMGTHLGRYGLDLPEAGGLSELLEEVVGEPGLGRVRLSSLEPMEATEGVAALVCDHPLVCRHIHLPLQSGSDAVLERMGRPYSAGQFAEVAEALAARCDGLCVGSDVMVGFPGETEAEFGETLALLSALPISYLHVFAYSPRPGTRAATMPGQVAAEVKARRSRALRDLSERKWRGFAASQVGTALEVVLERPIPDRVGLVEGLSDNYLRVTVGAAPDALGTIRRVGIQGVEGSRLVGDPAADQGPRGLSSGP